MARRSTVQRGTFDGSGVPFRKPHGDDRSVSGQGREERGGAGQGGADSSGSLRKDWLSLDEFTHPVVRSPSQASGTCREVWCGWTAGGRHAAQCSAVQSSSRLHYHYVLPHDSHRFAAEFPDMFAANASPQRSAMVLNVCSTRTSFQVALDSAVLQTLRSSPCRTVR